MNLIPGVYALTIGDNVDMEDEDERSYPRNEEDDHYLNNEPANEIFKRGQRNKTKKHR